MARDDASIELRRCKRVLNRKRCGEGVNDRTSGHFSQNTHLGICNERHIPSGGWHNLTHPIFPRSVRYGLDVAEGVLPLFRRWMKNRAVGETKWSISGIWDVEAAIGCLDSRRFKDRRDADWRAFSEIYTNRTFLSHRLRRVVGIGLRMMMKRGDSVGLGFALCTSTFWTRVMRGFNYRGRGRRCVGAVDGGGTLDRDREAGGESGGGSIGNIDRYCGCAGAGGTGAGRATSTGGSAARSGTRMHGGRGNGTRRKDRAP